MKFLNMALLLTATSILSASAFASPASPYLIRKLELLAILDSSDYSDIIVTNAALQSMEYQSGNTFLLGSARCTYSAEVTPGVASSPIPKFDARISNCVPTSSSSSSSPSGGRQASGGISSGGGPAAPGLFARLALKSLIESEKVAKVLGPSAEIEKISETQFLQYKVSTAACEMNVSLTVSVPGPAPIPQFKVSKVSKCK